MNTFTCNLNLANLQVQGSCISGYASMHSDTYTKNLNPFCFFIVEVSDGRVGSSCKLSTNPCTASNSSCSSKTAVGKCVCNSGWQADTDFMCSEYTKQGSVQLWFWVYRVCREHG